MSPENQERVSAMALAMTQSVVRGATQQLASDSSTLGGAARFDAAADWIAVMARNGAARAIA